MIGPTLETARLILRPPEAADVEGIVAMMGDEETARYIGGVSEPAVAWRGLAAITGAWVLNGYSMFSVIEKETGRWVGRVGPWEPLGWPGHEVGWGLARETWGKGYATEAAAAAMDWAFDVLGWEDIIHCIDPANAPSQRVAARLGAVNRGPGKLPAPFQDSPVDIWGQTKAEWRARRA